MRPAVRFQLPEDMVGATSADMEGAPSAKPSSKRKRGNDAAASEGRTPCAVRLVHARGRIDVSASQVDLQWLTPLLLAVWHLAGGEGNGEQHSFAFAEPGKKRGRKPAGAAEPSDEPSPAERQVTVQAEPVLWRVNYDEFNRRCPGVVWEERGEARQSCAGGRGCDRPCHQASSARLLLRRDSLPFTVLLCRPFMLLRHRAAPEPPGSATSYLWRLCGCSIRPTTRARWRACCVPTCALSKRCVGSHGRCLSSRLLLAVLSLPCSLVH